LLGRLPLLLGLLLPLLLAVWLGTALVALLVMGLWRRNCLGALLLDRGGLLVGHRRLELGIQKF
jgi:hypothetical protein